jgi:hypothetical protein
MFKMLYLALSTTRPLLYNSILCSGYGNDRDPRVNTRPENGRESLGVEGKDTIRSML